MTSVITAFSLQGRRALITGGSRGIGAAIATLFADAGADVAICHFGDPSGVEALGAEFRAAGHRLAARDCDVADEAQVAALAAWTRETLGDPDILCLPRTRAGRSIPGGRFRPTAAT